MKTKINNFKNQSSKSKNKRSDGKFFFYTPLRNNYLQITKGYNSSLYEVKIK